MLLDDACLRRAVPALARDGVDQGARTAPDPDGADLDEVAREGRLRDGEPLVGEQLGEFRLGADLDPSQDVGDGSVPGGLRGGRRTEHLVDARWLHDHSSSLTSSAFWACNRFSASSQTADAGPSITATLISLPRWAGRQCRTIAAGEAYPSNRSSTA